MSDEMSGVVIDKITYPVHREVVAILGLQIKQIGEMQADRQELLAALEKITNLDPGGADYEDIKGWQASQFFEAIDIASAAITKHKART